MIYRQSLINPRQVFDHLRFPAFENTPTKQTHHPSPPKRPLHKPPTQNGQPPHHIRRQETPPSPLKTPTNTPADPIPIAIIGGTGLSSLPSPPFHPLALIPPTPTPWGLPSSPIAILRYTPPAPSSTDPPPSSAPSQPTIVAFLARHGAHHQYAPHEIPNRANVAALKKLGVKAAVGFSAVGSLREEVRPRDFLVAGGVVDWTKGVSFC